MIKFKTLKRHCQRWNEWRKLNKNSRWHKFTVLLKIRHSPSFEYFFDTEDFKGIIEALEKGLKTPNEALEKALENLMKGGEKKNDI